MDGSVFTTYSFEDLMKYGIAIIFFISTILAVIYAIWWGFLLVISAGSEDKVKAAVNHIRYAVLGLVVLVAVLFIAPIFLGFFGLKSYATYFTPSVILETIQEVTAKVLGTSSDTVSSSADSIQVNSKAFTSLD